MFRVVCVTTIFLISLHCDMKSNSVCKVEAKPRNYTGQLTNAYRKMKEYIDGIRRYIGLNTANGYLRKQRVKNDFLRYVGVGFDKLISPRKGDYANMRTLAGAPKRRTMLYLKTMRAAQMIMLHDYNVETHHIRTNDGYKLTIQRILSKMKLCSKKTVVLHHGLLGSSEDWLLLGPGLALPYLMSDLGYDVWLLNARGNRYSRSHASIDPNSFDFWDFSWHEMGIYDLPASITYISKSTNDTNLYYIGHSMGSTALLVLLSTFPEYNNKLKSVILLAPLAFMSNTRGPLKYFEEIQNDKKSKFPLVKEQWEFNADEVISTAIMTEYCRGTFKSCSNPLLLLANGGKEVSDPNLMENIIFRLPAGGSLKTLLHYAQLIRSGRFQMFDYGALKNIKNYEQEHPKTYNLTAIQTPIALFSSASDWLSSVLDVMELERQIHSVVEHHILKEDDFGHLDFIFSSVAPKLVYYRIIEMLEIMAERRIRVGNNFVTRII